MSKSYVTLEQAHCPICGENKDTGTLLLDRHLRDKFEMHTTTGIAICNDCKKYIKDDFVALVGIDEKKSVITDDRIKPEGAHRISEYLWLKRDAAKRMFNVKIETDFVYIDQEAIDKVKELVANAED